MGDIWSGFVHIFEAVLLEFYSWTGSAGLAIILFTILARLLILPLTLKSLQSMRKMQELQPQLKELQRKYGKDQQKLTEETMKLYREYKINPAGGCLPMLLQFPIFIGVYQAVINLTHVSVAEEVSKRLIAVLASNGLDVAALSQSVEQVRMGAQSFLWLPDLGQRDPYFILPVLSVLFQLIVQLMATPRVQDAQQKAMSQSMLVLPVVFGYIGFTFPSGAVLYWVVGSILSMIQQYVISGWGSLANYLTFLPPDRGLMPPVAPATTAVSGNGVSVSTETPQKSTFWEVLRPLMDQGLLDEQAPEDDTNDEAGEGVRRQFSQTNPRRRRTRR